MDVLINPIDREALRNQFQNAQPYPHMVIDNFLAPGVAEEISRSYPTFEQASAQGFIFNFVNEQRKIQITDTKKFPDAVRRLNDAISSPAFMADLEYITGIPRILADEQLVGGGMHLTGSGGRLDVHVDFNLIEDRKLFRRLNILLYLNPVWNETWGGHIELWDKGVRNCLHRCVPALNRCLIFETSDISYHGVAQVKAPPDVVRQSFAAYYYTREAPPSWRGTSHSTIFKARPDEKLRGWVQMPAEKLRRRVIEKVRLSKKLVKSWMGLP
ncbi:MAG: 2OG-Fe(II) oxygenase [Deltaproteobacteria bacterium]|nr:2OG-Fe(II) oxygenase [Deltaproteobacteria bacterium]